MKKFAFAGAAALAVAAVPVIAQQAPQRPVQQPMTRTAVQQMVAGQFAAVDADRDGFVTKAEADARRTAARSERQAKRAERRSEQFARLDADRNGQISQSEFNARTERRDRAERRDARSERRSNRVERRQDRREAAFAGRFGGRMIERADTDKDGRVSLAEATARPLARFDRLDANKDGSLTREERRAARALRQQNRAKRG